MKDHNGGEKRILKKRSETGIWYIHFKKIKKK